jgi:hypothetical protein
MVRAVRAGADPFIRRRSSSSSAMSAFGSRSIRPPSTGIALATVATWFMTLIIQRAEYRDTQAIHAKLDELLRAEGGARNELTMLDEQEPENIEEHRSWERKRGVIPAA